MIELSKISRTYDIRRLDDSNADIILSFCQKNTQFYEYCEAEPTREQVLNDLHISPPGISISDKYYIGFYNGETLIAIMDLIDGYPEPEIAFIGFFMMNKDLQDQGIGTAIIRETAEYLKTTRKTSIRLAIDKGNPQSGVQFPFSMSGNNGQCRRAKEAGLFFYARKEGSRCTRPETSRSSFMQPETKHKICRRKTCETRQTELYHLPCQRH